MRWRGASGGWRMEDGAVLQCSAYIVDIDDTVGEIVLFQINRNIGLET